MVEIELDAIKTAYTTSIRILFYLIKISLSLGSVLSFSLLM